MRKEFRLVLWGVFVLMIILSVSCSPSPAGSPVGAEPAEPEVEEPAAGVAEEPAAEVAEEAGGEETEAPVEEAGTGGEVPVSDNGVPADIPVPENAYQLQVVRNGQIVSYQVDGSIDDIVTFYTDTLPGFGWEKTNSPDTVVAALASLLRENEAGDNMSISMQANELGGFVRITISVNRSN